MTITYIEIQMHPKHTQDQLNEATKAIASTYPYAAVKLVGWRGGDIGQPRAEITSDDPMGGMEEVEQAHEKIRKILEQYPVNLISAITSWDNPMIQYCAKQLRKVPDFNLKPEIQFVDQVGGKPDYYSRLVSILFSQPDESGDVEKADEVMKYIKALSKDERIEFVAYMRMYANAGMVYDAKMWTDMKEREAQRKRDGREKDPNYARAKQEPKKHLSGQPGRALCGRPGESILIVANPEDVTCEMCKKLGGKLDDEIRRD